MRHLTILKMIVVHVCFASVLQFGVYYVPSFDSSGIWYSSLNLPPS